MNLNVVFYAEVASKTNSKSIGLGHVFRLYPIYKKIRKKIKKTSLFLPINKHRLEILKIDGAEIIEPGLAAILKKITDINPDVVVLDGYDLSEEIAESLSKSISSRIVMFDDHYSLNTVVDTVINTSLHMDASRYNEQVNSLLLGPKYAPVVDEIMISREKYKVNKKIKKIIISLGGNDAMNNLDTVITFLSGIKLSSVEVHVIGEKPPKYNNSGIEYLGWKTPEVLSEILYQYDLAILAGGSMLFQFACVGVPVICWPQTQNQLLNAENWERNNALCLLRDIDELSKHLNTLNDYESRQNFYNNSRKIVDGIGAERIVSHIQHVAIDKRL